MLPILVLFFATSALAAPGLVNVRQISANDISSRDNSLIGRAFSIIDEGDININTVNLETILKDLSQRSKQGEVLGPAVALLGELSTGRPGDACNAARAVNTFAGYVAGRNSAADVRGAIKSYIQSVVSNIDNIVRLVSNPESVRFASGSRGGCPGEGRTYQFESAWESIIGSASPNTLSLVNEEYCTAKRLYCAFNARSNNAGAQITASSLPPTAQVYNAARGPLSNFVAALGSKSNVGQSAASLKQALINAASRINL